MGEPAVEVQLRDEARQIMRTPRLLNQIDRRTLAGTGGQVDGQLGRQFVPVDQHVEQVSGDQGDHLLGDVNGDEVAADEAGLNGLVGAKAGKRVGIGLVAPLGGRIFGKGADRLDGAVFGDDFGHGDRKPLATGNGGLLGGGDRQDELHKVFLGEDRGLFEDRDGDGFNVASELQGDLARQDRRGAQRDR